MRDKDNPLVRVVLDSGRTVVMYLHEALAAGLIDEEEARLIQDKQRKPEHKKQVRKR